MLSTEFLTEWRLYQGEQPPRKRATRPYYDHATSFVRVTSDLLAF